MWKTTDRSINQRRMKALEAENKVSLLYISDPEGDIAKSDSAPAHSSEERTSVAKIKRPQESDDLPNSTQKRRQVSEPHVACLTAPGEILRFISTKRHKLMRKGSITREQLKHLSRKPWERRPRLNVQHRN